MAHELEHLSQQMQFTQTLVMLHIALEFVFFLAGFMLFLVVRSMLRRTKALLAVVETYSLLTDTQRKDVLQAVRALKADSRSTAQHVAHAIVTQVPERTADKVVDRIRGDSNPKLGG